MKKYYINSFLIIIFFAFSLFLFSAVSRTEAQTSPALGYFGGYAWSPNIGWISMSGVSFSPIANAAEAQIAEARVLSGYAWSPNVGWISFQETSGCPSGSYCGSKFYVMDNAFIGWARVLSMKTTTTENRDQEFNLTTENTEDWASGWIKLNDIGVPNSGALCYVLTGGTSGPGGGPTGNIAGTCSGYAWGSRAIGWINFSKVIAGFYAGSDANVSLFADNANGIAESGPVFLPQNSFVHLTWTGTNLSETMPNCNLIYSYNDGPPFHVPPLVGGQIWNLSSINPSYQHGTSAGLPNGKYKYHMVCNGLSIGGIMNYGHSNDLFVFIGTEMPTVSLESPYCNTLVASASNLPSGSQCTGTAIQYLGNSLPPWLPINNVPSGNYSLKCGGVEKWATVYEVGINCENFPSQGGKKPNYQEN